MPERVTRWPPTLRGLWQRDRDIQVLKKTVRMHLKKTYGFFPGSSQIKRAADSQTSSIEQMGIDHCGAGLSRIRYSNRDMMITEITMVAKKV